MKLVGADPPNDIPPAGECVNTFANGFGFDFSANHVIHPPPVEAEVDATAETNSVEAEPPNVAPPDTDGTTVVLIGAVPASVNPPDAVTVMVRETSAAPANASPPVPTYS